MNALGDAPKCRRLHERLVTRQPIPLDRFPASRLALSGHVRPISRSPRIPSGASHLA